MGCTQSIETTQGQKVSTVKQIEEPQVQGECSQSLPDSAHYISDKVFDFNAEIKQIRTKILALPEKDKIFRNSTWEHIFNTFQKLYLNPTEKVEYIEFLTDLLKGNFGQTSLENEIEFCGDIGKDFQNLENRIYFKHKYCLQNFFFAIKPEDKQSQSLNQHFGALQLDLSDEQVQKLTGKVRNLCQNDLNSFSFITLYLIHAIKKFIESKKSLKEVQGMLESVLIKLQKLYPASTNSTNVNEEELTFKNLEKVNFHKNYDVLKFIKGGKSHYEQLRDFVIEKAEMASQDKEFFLELVYKTCTKKGYGFKYGLKIKNENNQSAIFRTIEKVLDEEKYDAAFMAQKKKILQSQQNFGNNQINKLKAFVEMEKVEVKKLITGILQKETEISFDAKDLLRAKCLYNKPNELIEAVEELLQIFSEKNISLIEFKNRLNKKTKDLAMVIHLPHSIAQLQLALKFDTTSNEFNHKIYELLRSRIYTPLTNLYVQNESWGSIFFTDQFEIFHEIVKREGMQNFDENITFKEIEDEVIEFKQRFLSNDFLSIAVESQENNAKATSNIIECPLKELNDVLLEGYKLDFDFSKRQQLLNEIAFYQKSNNYEQAQQLLKQLNSKAQVNEQNPIVIKLKATLFFEKADYAKALEYYQKLIELDQTSSQAKTTDFAHIEMNAGLSCKYLGYFQDALEYLNDALAIYEQLFGQESWQYSNILYTLGMVYDDQKNYDKALETYTQCLKIQEQVVGKDSIEVANTIHNMGLVYNTLNKYEESADCYQKCLKIQQYILGKESIECAITLGNMGVLYDNMKLPQKALEMYQRSLLIKQKISGRNSYDCAITLNNIAMVYEGQKNYEKALTYYLESIAIKESIKGEQDIDCAYSYLNLSILYFNMKRYQDAIPYAEKSYQIRRDILGDDNPDTALSLQWVQYEKSQMAQGQ